MGGTAVTLMGDLLVDTVTLIQHTREVPAIKCLINVHDILECTLHVERSLLEYKHQPSWTRLTAKELDNIRCTLLVRHGTSFDPAILMTRYYRKLGTLLDLMSYRVL